MQAVYKNKDKRDGGGRINLIGTVVCAGRISRYMKGEYIRGFGSRNIGIRDCRGIFDRY